MGGRAERRGRGGGKGGRERTEFNFINVRFEFGDIMRDPDGKTRHGVMRFRAIILGN